MEKIKEHIKLQQKNELNQDEKEASYQQKMEQLKPDINNLLHQYLPGDITIDETEALALAINDVIWHPRNYLTNKSD